MAKSPSKKTGAVESAPTIDIPPTSALTDLIAANTPDAPSIEEERAALKEYIEADDLDEKDPRYARYMALLQREAALERQREEHANRHGAEAIMPTHEATRAMSMGPLLAEDEEAINIHTREGARLFMGRAVRPGESGYSMPGAKRIGAALKMIWYLSGNDNPYADCCLIEAHESISRMVHDLDRLTDDMEGKLNRRNRRDVRFSVLSAKPPVSVVLGFKSPYGFALVNLVAAFDYFTRMSKTLENRDLLSNTESYQQVHSHFRKIRSLFERVLWWQRYLNRPELLPLSRSDWLPTADEQATKRVKAATAIFGELPRGVFTGVIAPRHSKRRVQLSQEELRLLNEVPLTVADPELEAAAERLEL